MQRKGEAAKTGEQSQDKLYVRGKVEELKRSIKSRKRKIKIQLVKANIPEYIQTHGVVCERETEEREKNRDSRVYLREIDRLGERETTSSRRKWGFDFSL